MLLKNNFFIDQINRLYYEIISNYMNNHDFSKEKINTFGSDEGIRNVIVASFDFSIIDISNILESVINNYTDIQNWIGFH